MTFQSTLADFSQVNNFFPSILSANGTNFYNFPGFAGGAFALVAPLYIVEIAETSMRGALASLMQFMVTIGIAFVDGLNVQDAVHWDIISGICVLVPVLLAVAMFMMPESPYYLVSRGRDERALRSLRWLRGLEYNSEKELKDIKTAYQAESEIGSISIKTLLTERVYVRPFIIVSLLMMFQQFSGVNVVIFYAQVIFRDAGSDIDPGKQNRRSIWLTEAVMFLHCRSQLLHCGYCTSCRHWNRRCNC